MKVIGICFYSGKEEKFYIGSACVAGIIPNDDDTVVIQIGNDVYGPYHRVELEP